MRRTRPAIIVGTTANSIFYFILFIFSHQYLLKKIKIINTFNYTSLIIKKKI